MTYNRRVWVIEVYASPPRGNFSSQFCKSGPADTLSPLFDHKNAKHLDRLTFTVSRSCAAPTTGVALAYPWRTLRFGDTKQNYCGWRNLSNDCQILPKLSHFRSGVITIQHATYLLTYQPNYLSIYPLWYEFKMPTQHSIPNSTGLSHPSTFSSPMNLLLQTLLNIFCVHSLMHPFFHLVF